ncbi:MAG: hypothetical protein SVW57_12390 [Thermodesulfobacteriota bacterium]|nr:hypothetical protein [Thermodesulfobacteriota bacterium]
MRTIEDTDVFKLAHELTLEVHRLTESFPQEENYRHPRGKAESMSKMITKLAMALNDTDTKYASCNS